MASGSVEVTVKVTADDGQDDDAVTTELSSTIVPFIAVVIVGGKLMVCGMLIVNVTAFIELLVKAPPPAMAFTVVVLLTINALVYAVDEVLGAVPSVV